MLDRFYEVGEWLERWRVLDRFQGSWGVVYVLEDSQHDGGDARPPILIGKTLQPYFITEPKYIERFERECYAWLKLGKYKHIVRLFFVDRIYGQAVAFAEYVPTTLLPNTLRGWLNHNLIECEAALRYGVQLCRALEYARSKGLLVHQDLKPENIMITPSGVLQVTDWGLSKVLPSRTEGLPAVGDVPYRFPGNRDADAPGNYGTLGYIAPELTQSTVVPTPQADMYSLGTIVCEMLFGERPAPGTASAEIRERLSALPTGQAYPVAEMLASCLSTSPDRRPGNTAVPEAALSDAFEELVGVPIEQAPAHSPQQPTDITQEAYGLFMLGKIDEAMYAQQQAKFDQADAKTGPPFMLIDYKEEGFKLVVPEEHVREQLRQHEADPDKLEKLTALIDTLDWTGSDDQALALCERWLTNHPEEVEILKRGRRLASKLGWTQRASELNQRLQKLVPEDAQVWLQQAIIFKEEEKMSKAINAYKKAIAINPRDASLYNELGHCLEEEGDLDGALEQFEMAIDIDPENSLALFNAGTICVKQDDLVQAYPYLLKAVEIDPDFSQALNTLGIVMMKINHLQEAMGYFQRAIAADAHYARPWFNLGQIYQHLGKDTQARQAYEKALAIDPGHALAKKALQGLKR